VDFVPPNLVLVLDKSGSMLAPFGTSTRWETLVQVVTQVTSAYENVIQFGAKWFPTALSCMGGTSYYCDGVIFGADCFGIVAGLGDACTVNAGFDSPALAPTLNNAANIVSALPTAVEIDQYCWTPTQSGFEEAVAALKLAVPDATEDRRIMLIIDGAISDGTLYTQGCIESVPAPFIYTELDSGLLGAISNAFSNDGIVTYVVTIDAVGAGTVTQANAYAQAGGAPNPDPGSDFYPGDDPTQLNLALDSIAASVVTCDIQLSVPPLSPDDVAVTVDGVSYDQVSAADCGNSVDGWYYSVPYTQMTLCGNACDAFKALPVPSADVEFFCTGGG
jgi:hypothetical protein